LGLGFTGYNLGLRNVGVSDLGVRDLGVSNLGVRFRVYSCWLAISELAI